MGLHRKEERSYEEDNTHYIAGIRKIMEEEGVPTGTDDGTGHGRRHGIRGLYLSGELWGTQCNRIFRKLFQYSDHVFGGKEPGGRI